MNWDMLGHEWAVNLLSKHVAQDHVRHAYLFSGPTGVGRRTLALRLAQAVNCLQPPAPGQPCHECRICKQIGQMSHADLAIIEGEKPGGLLKVDQIRELQRSLALAPYDARFRVAVLLRFEDANVNAMNALLKTLEEPAPKVVIVLTAESAERLLPTIVSRCENLRLRPLALDQVSHGLQTRWQLPADQAQMLAHISGGRPGYALRLHQDPDQLDLRQTWLDDHYRLLSASRVDRFAYTESIWRDKNSLRMMLLVWLSLWRDVLLKAAGAAAPCANLDRDEEIENLAARYGLPVAHQTIAALERTINLLEKNVNARLASEVLMLDLPFL